MTLEYYECKFCGKMANAFSHWCDGMPHDAKVRQQKRVEMGVAHAQKLKDYFDKRFPKKDQSG